MSTNRATIASFTHAQINLRTISTIRDVLEAGDFGSFDVIVEALSNDYDVLAIAAAAAKVAHEATAPSVVEEKELDLSVPDEALRKTPSRSRTGAVGSGGAPSSRQRDAGKKRSHQAPSPRPQARPGPRRGLRGNDTGDYVRIHVPLGRDAGVRPADLVGAIANEAGIDSREIGAIEITDRFSLVEVPDRRADAIVKALKRTKLRGRPVKARRE